MAGEWQIIKDLYKGFGNNPRNAETFEALANINPLFSAYRGAKTLSNIDVAPMRQSILNEAYGISDPNVNRQAANQVKDTLFGLLDVAPTFPVAKAGAKGLLKVTENLPAGMSIKDVGRKLTPFEEAFNLAQQRAALPVSEGGLGLPPTNTAMDRAKATGVNLDNPLYYGSQNNILSFDPSKIGSRFDYSFGHHTTTSPNEASVYADSLTNAGENFNPKAKLSIPVAEGANVMKLYGRTENPLRIKTDYPAASMEADIQRSEIIDKLWNARQANNPYDAVIIDAKNNKNFIALKPELLRSPNAAFDPFRRNEPDLLAGVAAAPVGLLAIEEEKTKKKRSNK
jgi:hypothetical protein